MTIDKAIELRAHVMICTKCGLGQFDNLFHDCRDCGGKLIHRFNKEGKPIDLGGEMVSEACRKCGVVLHGSKKWVERKLAEPCNDHKGNGTTLWQ